MSALAHKARPQTLLLLKGHPATGKSTLANALARQLGWPLIDKDDIKDHIYHLPNGGHLSYAVMWQIVRHQLAIGLSVLVDSPLSYPTTYATGQELATEFGTRLVVVETTIPDALWRERLDERTLEAQTHRTAGWDNMQRLLADYNASWRYPIDARHHIVVDTSQPTTQLVQRITDFLDAK